MLTMKGWIKAVAIACLVELLLLVPLAIAQLTHSKKLIQSLLTCLTFYHMLSISLAFTVLNTIWAWHGPASQPIRTPETLLYLLVGVFQVVLTTPIIYGLLTWIGHVRRKRTLKGDLSPEADG